MNTNRKYYIDNLRTAAVLLVIPYHVLMMFNNWGESFYVRFESLFIPSLINALIWPWFMPVLFVLAGMSAFYSVQKRGVRHFMLERVKKLFIPLCLGILFVIPVQTFYAEKFHNGYTGSYLRQYVLFFTKPTDFTGYDGGFTPGQLWFILYLFIISICLTPVLHSVSEAYQKKYPVQKPVPFWVLPAVLFASLLCKPLLNIGGKSIIEYAYYYAAGYLLFSKDDDATAAGRKITLLAVSTAVFGVLFAFLFMYSFYKTSETVYFIAFQLYAVSVMLLLISFFSRYLNKTNAAMTFLSGSSYTVYFVHQSLLVCFAYHLSPLSLHPAVLIPLLIILTTASSFAVVLFLKISIQKFIRG